MNLLNDGSFISQVRNRGFVYVYAVQNEYILARSSSRDDGGITELPTSAARSAHFQSPENSRRHIASSRSYQ